MTEALRVADHAGIEELAGLVLRDGAGNDAPAGIFAVEHDLHVARGLLMAVGEQALGDDALGILAADDLRVARICTVSIWMLAPSSRYTMVWGFITFLPLPSPSP